MRSVFHQTHPNLTLWFVPNTAGLFASRVIGSLLVSDDKINNWTLPTENTLNPRQNEWGKTSEIQIDFR